MSEIHDHSITIGPLRFGLWRCPATHEWGVLASLVIGRFGLSLGMGWEDYP